MPSLPAAPRPAAPPSPIPPPGALPGPPAGPALHRGAAPAPPARPRSWAGLDTGLPRGFQLGALALAVGGAGEALLFDAATRGLGAVLLALGVLLAGVAWRGVADAPAWEPAGAWGRVAWRPVLALRLAGLAGALGLAAAAVRVNQITPTAIFGAQGALWLVAMVLLLLACARWYPRTAPDPGAGPPWTRGEAAGFLALVGLALVTHLAFLDAIPWRFHFDEGFAFTETMRYYRGPPIPLFTTTWHGTSLPSLWFAFAAGLMRFTGNGLGGVRDGVALIGALTTIPVYGFARLAWGRLAAVLAAFGVAASAAAVHYSRVSIDNMTTGFAWAVCFYFLLRGFHSRRPGDFAWAGLAAGLSQYTYYGTRLLPYLLLALAGYLLVCHWRATRERLGHLALVAAGFLVGFGPLLGYFLLHPTRWAARGLDVLNVPPAIPATPAGWIADWNVLAPLAWKNFLGLSVLPGADTVYYAPLLLAPEALLLTLGLGLLLWRWRQPAAFLVLLWALGVVLAGGTLLDAATIPNFAHWAPAFPALYLAAALPPACLLGSLPRRRPALRRAAAAALALALVFDLGANAYAYLVQYPARVPAGGSLETVQGRFLAGLAPGTRVRIVDPGGPGLYPEVAGMLAPQIPASNLFNPSRELPLPGDPGHDLAFVFYGDPPLLLPATAAYYPGGQVRPLRTPGGTLVATAYVVPAAAAAAQYGVQVTVASVTAPGAQRQGTVHAVGALPAGGALPYPALATWSGAVWVAGGAPVRLTLEGAARAKIWVDGQVVDPAAALAPEPGWLRFTAQALLQPHQTVRLLLQEGAGPPAPVDPARLWPLPPTQGLAATLGGGAALRHRVDPFLAAPLWRLGAPGDPDLLPLGPAGGSAPRGRWAGELLTASGTYTMTLRTDADALLTIDGRPVVRACGTGAPPAGTSGAAPLTAGWHTVQLDIRSASGQDGLLWLWTRPDGVQEAVPPAALRVPGGGQTPMHWPAVPPPVMCRP